MPPVTVGPPGDPFGFGPTANLGPPPGPMYPTPGPYAAPLFQPPPPGSGPGGELGYGTAPHWWASGDYLLYFANDQHVRFPILTTGSPNQAGVLGQPTTTQLITGDNIKYSAISGFRLAFGFFGDADRRFGFELGGMYTERKRFGQQFSATLDNLTSVGIPVLARPFIDTTTGANSTLVVGSSNLGVGRIRFDTSTSTYSINPNGVLNLYRTAPGSRWAMSLDFLMGYKFLELKEDFNVFSETGLNQVTITPIFRPGPFGVPIQIGTRITPTPVAVGGVTTIAPATVSVSDRFTATNRFNGGTIALRSEIRYGIVTLTTTSKLGIGNMHQVLEIQGTTAFANPATGLGGSAFGGLYANPTNIGKFDNDEFAVIPEINLNVGVNLTRSLSMYIGYNYLYVNKVARPGSQINPNIDATTIPFSATYGNAGSVPGTRRLFVQDEFWLQGVNFGFQLRY